LDSLRKLKVLVVGEAIIDEYQYCQAIGKSSKEPMLAVKSLGTEKFGGGILAVANNVANFCDNVGLITVLGSENSQEEFVRDSLDQKIDARFLFRDDAPTIVKRRFIEEYHFTKLLEVYEINDESMGPTASEDLCTVLKSEIPKYDLVLVVDFGHGMLDSKAIGVLCSTSNFLAMNSQSNAGNLGYHTVSRFPRADFVCMSENEARLETRDRHGDLKNIMLDVSQELSCDRVVVTRGKGGCICYSKEDGFFELPALSDLVLDRMGSGDAFLSVAAMCIAQRVPMEVAGFIGNVVGAEAVATVGHRSSIQRVPLIRHIQTLLK
jgi:bifunctional ADP-heptose synthase (sugar kinase/adenylyltransferase)